MDAESQKKSFWDPAWLDIVLEMKKSIAIAVIALLMQACVTPYQPSGLRGGFSETRLDERVYRIQFSGNAFTSRERVADFVLLRGAHLTLENGYKYFSVNERERSVLAEELPQTFETNVNSLTGSITTTQTGGGTIFKAREANMIFMYKQKPQLVFAYDAEYVRDSIEKKHGFSPEQIREKKEIAQKQKCADRLGMRIEQITDAMLIQSC
ncbi:MAG: hypothetical protein MPK75_11605 [Alphaproteobacteria bacterium]|nr:hypothetical protein [Alphaproteobacteria bacterium]